MTDYFAVTEIPGSKITAEQLARVCNRYYFASQFCPGKEVLEVACGPGVGLGYLAKFAKRVVAGDIDKNILRYAQKHYQGRENIELKLFDAHRLPFENGSFDVVILYEAIYYLTQPKRFVEEAYRMLREDGTFIICTVNKDWSDFNSSLFSTNYFSASELFSLLNQRFHSVEIYGAFPVTSNSIKDRIISLIKRTAVILRIMPKTMKGKEFLKRLFFGRLQTLPAEIDEKMAEYSPPLPISPASPNPYYMVLYAVGQNPL